MVKIVVVAGEVVLVALVVAEGVVVVGDLGNAASKIKIWWESKRGWLELADWTQNVDGYDHDPCSQNYTQNRQIKKYSR